MPPRSKLRTCILCIKCKTMGVTSLGPHTRPVCNLGHSRELSLKLCEKCGSNYCVCVLLSMGSRESFYHIWALIRHFGHVCCILFSDWLKKFCCALIGYYPNEPVLLLWAMDPTQISCRVFFLTEVFFRQVFSGLCSDSILCKLSLSSVLVLTPHIWM